jgi:mevalonate kinase
MNGSAFGKVILLGEHAVVYGVPAIVVGIDRGATAWAAAADKGEAKGGPSELVLSADGRERSLTVMADATSDLARAFRALLEACGVTAPVRVEAATDLPPAAGLGCSAALGVAIVRALDAWLGRPAASPDIVVIGAPCAWEKIFHGNPLASTPRAAASRGCLLYERSHGGVRMHELSLDAAHARDRAHRNPIDHPRDGRAWAKLTIVRLFNVIGPRMDFLPGVDGQGVPRVLAAFMSALLRGQALPLVAGGQQRRTFMAVEDLVEAMCRIAREAGALGAKLTGSGGGGCVVALVESDAEPILAGWEKAGFRSFSTHASQRAAPSERSQAP